ncbi:thrombospondin type 3 repeat-containing protein [Spirosoma rigui]|uniref:thrombospondin type 3 repeat-containing protein n=1 Tax=Spirosoma rigui TaxID=564064 RepID=UPI0009B17FFF|nr:thrombospondin type 3 repeat-containing protein [Spirosoma rigui]
MNPMIHFTRSGIRWQLLLMLLLPLTVWASPPALVLAETTKTQVAVADADNDGVPDANDRCPNTPTGTTVNTYGCPLTQTTCDFTTVSITLTSTGGSGDGMLRYVLADSVGQILQASETPSFTGLTGAHTYMALSISHDGSVSNLTAGQSLSSVTATCFDWSDALIVRVCVPQPPPPARCDYTIGTSIVLTSTGGSITAGTLTRYVLVDSAGLMVQIASGPSFATAGLLPGSYSAYALVYSDDQRIVNLQTGQALGQVQSSCLALSDPLRLTLCNADCVARCVPFVIRRIR